MLYGQHSTGSESITTPTPLALYMRRSFFSEAHLHLHIQKQTQARDPVSVVAWPQASGLLRIAANLSALVMPKNQLGL